ncbi:MAG TPA: hypothetical protein VGK85_08505 [Myxococcaceae bacterium]
MGAVVSTLVLRGVPSRRAERLCCPFFRVALGAQPQGAGLDLELGGAPGVKRFIESELPVALSGK